MATEEYLAVSELTPLSSPRETDFLVVQTPGEYGDVMLAQISDIISEILDHKFARLQSPEFTGEPIVPSISDLTSSDQRIANTEFVQAIAEKKAAAKDPEIEGQAVCSEKIPKALDDDGDTVVLATQKDISAVNLSISELAGSTSTLAAAVASLSDVKSVAVPSSTNKITVTEQETMATKSAGIVTCCLRFTANSAVSPDTQLFLLPVGYRPGRTYRFTEHSWNGTDHYTMSIYSHGSIVVHNAVAAGKAFIISFAFHVPDTSIDNESGGTGGLSGGSITVDSALSSSSANPVQNKVIKLALDNKADKSTATSSADGLMSSTDKQHLDAVYADYTAMLALI